MSIIARFNCGDCGYGPFEVEDNSDAPIPSPPISIHHDDCEGRPLSSCPKCDAPLPEFVRKPPRPWKDIDDAEQMRRAVEALPCMHCGATTGDHEPGCPMREAVAEEMSTGKVDQHTGQSRC